MREHDFVILIDEITKTEHGSGLETSLFDIYDQRRKEGSCFTDPLLRNFQLEVIFYKSGMGNMGRAGPMTVRARISLKES